MKVKSCLRWVLTTTFIIQSIILLAQEALPRVPRMHVSKAESDSRDKWFQGDGAPVSKAAIISRITNGKQRFSQVTGIGAFHDFVFNTVLRSDSSADAINIYFGAFSAKNAGGIPVDSLSENEIVLLYTPAKMHGDCNVGDLGSQYFYLSPWGKIIPIEKKIKDAWVANYVEKFIAPPDGLTQGLDPNDSSNLYGDSLSDTRSIFYPKFNLEEMFEAECEFQKKQNGITFLKVKIYLSSYGAQGDTDLSKQHVRYKGRLIIQFDIIGAARGVTTEKSIYLDEQPEFHRRRPKLPKACAADNGHLCPLNCPDDGGKTNKKPIK